MYSNMISSFRTDSDILKRVEVTDDTSKSWLQPRVNQSGEESYASWLVLRADETGAYTVIDIGRTFE